MGTGTSRKITSLCKREVRRDFKSPSVPLFQRGKFKKLFSSPHALQSWGARFSRILKPGDVVALIGPLGSGKTTLVQGVAEGWGYKTGATSPTFALMNEYRSRRGLLLHLDMYRLSTAELESFPLEDYLDPSAVCLVEWADRVAGRLPDEALDIHLKIRSPNARLLNISACSSDWRKRLKPLLPAAM